MSTVKLDSILTTIGKEIDREERKLRRLATMHIKAGIKEKARGVKIKGDLLKGVYHRHGAEVSFAGIHSPGRHNFLVEYGHFTGKPGSTDRKFVKPNPIVNSAFEERSPHAIQIMSEPLKL